MISEVAWHRLGWQSSRPDAPGAILAAMTRHPEDEPVQLNGCFALGNLALDEEGCRQILAAGDVPAAILAAMAADRTGKGELMALILNHLNDEDAAGDALDIPEEEEELAQQPVEQTGVEADDAALADVSDDARSGGVVRLHDGADAAAIADARVDV